MGSFSIDGNNIFFEQGDTILRASERADIKIPKLCDLKGLSPFGGCRMCIVKVDGLRGYPTACTTIVSEGMKVTAFDDELKKMRQTILKLILVEHPSACMLCPDKVDCFAIRPRPDKSGAITGCQTCPNRYACELRDLVEELELDSLIAKHEYRYIPTEQTDPFIEIDLNLCIMCGRCARVCDELRGSSAITFVNKGDETMISKPSVKPQIEENCDYCGSCIDVCPTGTLTSMKTRWYAPADKVFETVCPYCSVGCKLDVGIKNNRIVSVKPSQDADGNIGYACVNGYFGIAELPMLSNRLRNTKVRKFADDKPVELPMKETIEFTVESLKKFKPEEIAVVVSPTISIEDAFVMQKFARNVLKTNNIAINGFLGDEKMRRILHERLGTGKWQAELEDIDTADNIITISADLERLGGALDVRLNRSNACIYVINTYPTRTMRFGAKYIEAQKNRYNNVIGGFAKAVANSGFASKHEGYQEFNQSIQSFDDTDFTEFKDKFAGKKNIIILSGHCDFEAISMTTDFAAMIDAKILPLYESGNYAGLIKAGCCSDVLPGSRTNPNAGILTQIELLEKIKLGEIKALYVLGDLANSDMLQKLEFLAVQDFIENSLTDRANVVFPAVGFGESAGTYVNSEGKLQQLPKILDPSFNVQPDWKILCEIAKSFGAEGFEYESAEEIFKEYSGVSISVNTDANDFSKFKHVPFIESESCCNTCEKMCYDLRPMPKYKSANIIERISGFADIHPNNAVYLNEQVAESLEKLGEFINISNNGVKIKALPIIKTDYPDNFILVKSSKLIDILSNY